MALKPRYGGLYRASRPRGIGSSGAPHAAGGRLCPVRYWPPPLGLTLPLAVAVGTPSFGPVLEARGFPNLLVVVTFTQALGGSLVGLLYQLDQDTEARLQFVTSAAAIPGTGAPRQGAFHWMDTVVTFNQPAASALVQLAFIANAQPATITATAGAWGEYALGFGRS